MNVLTGLTGRIADRLRSIGLRHKLGYAKVWLRSLMSPPPPQGSFPEVSRATVRPNGLLAMGGILDNETLLAAYAKGIYPSFYKKPVKWWSNDPRMVLFIEKMRIEKKGLRRIVRSGRYTVTFDHAFEEVIRNCSDREQTWLTSEMIQAFISLHEVGHAHSVEVWDMEGHMVGGLYGMDLGRIFTTESGFTRARDASKVAFMYLSCHLQHWGYVLNDVQTPSHHSTLLGCEPIPREHYVELLSKYAVTDDRRLGKWAVDERFDVGAWIPSEPGSQLTGCDDVK